MLWSSSSMHCPVDHCVSSWDVTTCEFSVQLSMHTSMIRIFIAIIIFYQDPSFSCFAHSIIFLGGCLLVVYFYLQYLHFYLQHLSAASTIPVDWCIAVSLAPRGGRMLLGVITQLLKQDKHHIITIMESHTIIYRLI